MEAARSVLRVYSQRKRNRVQRYSPRAEVEAEALRRLRARHDLARPLVLRVLALLVGRAWVLSRSWRVHMQCVRDEQYCVVLHRLQLRRPKYSCTYSG